MDSIVEKLTPMLSKLTYQNKNQTKPFKPKIYQGKGDIKDALIIMTKVGSEAEVGQVIVTDSEDFLTEVDLSMDKISEQETS